MDATRSARLRRRAVAAAWRRLAASGRGRIRSRWRISDSRLPNRNRRSPGDQTGTHLRLPWRQDRSARDSAWRNGLAPERGLGRGPGASGRPGLRVHAGDQRAAACAHRAAGRSKGGGPGRMVRCRQRYADRTAAELRTARGNVLLVRGADGSLSGFAGDRPERVRAVLPGSLATGGVKSDAPTSGPTAFTESRIHVIVHRVPWGRSVLLVRE